MSENASAANGRGTPFVLDGRQVVAAPGESIWQVARRIGVDIPHLCWQPEPDYRADGNCRACMVEVVGERTLAASCIRKPAPGMEVRTNSLRAQRNRALVFELLQADSGAASAAHDPDSIFARRLRELGINGGRFPARPTSPPPDDSHMAMRVNLDACIHCNLCLRACREVQVNDVIGMAGRGADARIVFDFDDPMGLSSCVACGECVQACPTGALMPATMLDDRQQHTGPVDKRVNSLCPWCGVGCQTEIQLREGRIVQVLGRDGPANRKRLCVKGRFGMDYADHPQRLTTPLIRREDAPKRWDDEIGPENIHQYFREAGWDEALDRAAAGFREARDSHGPDALAGFGCAKGSNEEAYLFQKLMRAGIGTNNVDHCTRLCHASSVAALLEGMGSGAVTAPFAAALDADCILMIGCRPEWNHPVAASFFKQAVKRGARLVLADPRGQDIGRLAWRNLRFRPGTDVALLSALLHVIVSEKLTDEDYIRRYTDNYDALRARLTDCSPERMAPLCGIDAETLREVARAFAGAGRSIVFWGMGVSQHSHGTDNVRCLIALAAITGQIGRPGTGLHPLRGQNNVQGASDAGLIPMFYPDYLPVEDAAVRRRFEQLWGTKLSPKNGLTVVEIIDAANAGDIRAMLVMGENPAMSDPDTRHVRQGLARLQHLVVQEIFLTETAFFADVLLPASAFPEKCGTFTNTNRQLQMARPVRNPPGQARQDWRILLELGRRVGMNWHYDHPRDIYAEMAQAMRSLDNISWERLEREDSVTYPCPAPDAPGREILFADGSALPGGRIRLMPTELLPPAETPDDEYPMVLSTGRLLEHWHTGAMTRRAPVLDGLEPGPAVHLNPRFMALNDIAPGRMVTVRTRRGAVRLAARADRNVAEGSAFIPFCFAESPANMLTNPVLDPFGKIPEFKYSAARVEPD